MLNTVIQLVRPRQFEVKFTQIDMDDRKAIVRPTHLSICNADQRYYQGLRARDVMNSKLPMALIHEGIGEVLYDPTGSFRTGEKVIMIPNEPERSDDIVAENYLPDSRFRGSTMDGFMQEYIQLKPDRLVPVPPELTDLRTAAFTEMVSVCYHAISRFDRTAHRRRDTIGVWGDGNMGYFTSLLLKMRFPESRVILFGRTWEKMADFSFADDAVHTDEIPEDLTIDHAFECVGGSGAGIVINQIIDHINPEGTIAILGVSEEPVPINTRMILEKGLRVIGTSRSGRKDFIGLTELYHEKPQIVDYLEKMVGGVVEVRGVSDIITAFEMDIRKFMGKTIMIWS